MILQYLKKKTNSSVVYKIKSTKSINGDYSRISNKLTSNTQSLSVKHMSQGISKTILLKKMFLLLIEKSPEHVGQ